MNLKGKILSADDLPKTKVEVPEWGVTVYVRSMTGTERDYYEAELLENKDKPLKERLHNMRAKLVARCAVDEEGKSIFDSNDIELLGNKSADALNRITEVAQSLNALNEEDIEDIAGK